MSTLIFFSSEGPKSLFKGHIVKTITYRTVTTLSLCLTLFLPSFAQSTDLKADTWVASDALGRIMPTAIEAPLRTDKPRTVGIFYITWHDEGKFGLRAPYGGDVTRTLLEAPEARLQADHPAWSGAGFRNRSRRTGAALRRHCTAGALSPGAPSDLYDPA